MVADTVLVSALGVASTKTLPLADTVTDYYDVTPDYCIPSDGVSHWSAPSTGAYGVVE